MGLFSRPKKSNIDWTHLESEELLQQLLDWSTAQAILLFKHSTRCSISAVAKSRLESQWDIDKETLLPVYLDLIKFRSISNKIADDLNVRHESPQVIIVKDKKPLYNVSHSQISVDEIKKQL